MTPEDVYHGTRLAILEMIRSGTTRFNDMYWYAPAIARAADELGVRAVIGAAFVDLGRTDVAERWRREVEVWLEQCDDWGERIRAAIAPHAIYTVSEAHLRWLGDLAQARDLPFHIHLSETEAEVRDCAAAYGVRPARLLERLGLVGDRLLAAHGVHLDEDEMALLGRAGASVVTNPAANLKLAVGGIFDYSMARRMGVRVLIGTDGAASNNNLDLFEELKLLALLQKHRSGDPTTLPASEALALATTAAAAFFDRHDPSATGRIGEGEPADFLLLDLSGPATRPGHDVSSDLVYAANGGVVHTTVCDGRVLMHDRVVEVADEEEIVARATEVARRLTASA
jgi:5-methylthioadenosine/S-adenosylhomocysteine deaminase